MRALVQSLKDGSSELIEAPDPSPRPGHIVIATAASVVSAGTERMLVDFGRANPLQKARQQPERVREVLDKARADGIGPTVHAVRSKLEQPIALGYANAGYILELGAGVEGLRVGQLVASNGPHAEVVSVPHTLVASAPDGLEPAVAAFASLGSVGLQGIRLAQPTIGERFVVMGLGLIGQLTVQLLRAHGCEVLGIDIKADRLQLAAEQGATICGAGPDAERAAHDFSKGRGVDGVLITASTASNEPAQQAVRMCRRRGRVVIVGVTGVQLQRDAMYEREVSVTVSSSYGPGRYDPAYEGAGHDYPFGHVRWTAGRNFEAVLQLAASGALRVDRLITHRFPFADAPAAYDTLVSSGDALGIVLEYERRDVDRPIPAPSSRTSASPSSGDIAVIGTGTYATQTLLPALASAGGRVSVVVGRDGTAAALAARRAGNATPSTDLEAVLADPSIGVVVIATRHDSHAALAQRALLAGKHVFVEKPLAISAPQLADLQGALEAPETADRVLGIGFNRRFAPLTVAMSGLLARRPDPRAIVITVNAGAVPADHWVHDPAIGGGRLIGEGCHFIDLARHLAGAPIEDAHVGMLDQPGGSGDSAALQLQFENGSIASISYLSNGSKRFPKERIEVFCGGGVLVNDNFRILRTFGWSGARTKRLRRQDKGHVEGLRAFLAAARQGGQPPISRTEILEVSRWTIDLLATERR